MFLDDFIQKQKETKAASERFPLHETMKDLNLMRTLNENNTRERVFVFVHFHSDYGFYLEVYHWKKKDDYKRYVISEGVWMSSEEERNFSILCRTSAIVDRRTLKKIYDLFLQYHPEWHLDSTGPGLQMLHHIYHCFQRRTVQELLYKAALPTVAIHVEDYGECNLLSSTIQSYFSIPLQSIRALDSEYGIHLLKTYQSRCCIKRIYQAFPELFTVKLSYGQCMYLQLVMVDREYVINEDRAILSHLKWVTKKEHFFRWFHYFLKRELIKDLKKFPLFPQDEDTYESVFYMAVVLYEHKNVFNRELNFQQTENRYYEYSEGEFFIRLPRNVDDLYYEAEHQNNCLFMQYLFPIMSGHTMILFLRRKSQPEKPFVTIEIRDRKMVQAKMKHNKEIDNEKTSDWLQNYLRLKKIA